MDDMHEGLLELIANTLYVNEYGDMRAYTDDDCVTIGQFILGEGHTPDDYGVIGESYLAQHAGQAYLMRYLPHDCAV